MSVIPKHSKPKVTPSRPLTEGTEAGETAACPACLAVGAPRSPGGAFLFFLYVLFGERSLVPVFPSLWACTRAVMFLLLSSCRSNRSRCCVFASSSHHLRLSRWDLEVILVTARACSLPPSLRPSGCVNVPIDSRFALRPSCGVLLFQIGLQWKGRLLILIFIFFSNNTAAI